MKPSRPSANSNNSNTITNSTNSTNSTNNVIKNEESQKGLYLCLPGDAVDAVDATMFRDIYIYVFSLLFDFFLLPPLLLLL